MFLERGFTFTYEAVRDWEARFAPLLADQLRTKRFFEQAVAVVGHTPEQVTTVLSELRSQQSVSDAWNAHLLTH